MPKLQCSLIRINAGNDQADIWSGVDKENIYNKVIQLMTMSATAEDRRSSGLPGSVMLETSPFLSVWCNDGKTHTYEIFCDEDGLGKRLPPNHCVNAMIHAARFTTKSFDTVEESRNQQTKDSYGSNYFVGDVYFAVPLGCPSPDLSIFGNNPIKFLMQQRTPSKPMEQRYGKEIASNMLNPRMKKKLPSYFSGNVRSYREILNNAKWEFVDYHIIANGCDDDSYKALIRSWGYGTEKK